MIKIIRLFHGELLRIQCVVALVFDILKSVTQHKPSGSLRTKISRDYTI